MWPPLSRPWCKTRGCHRERITAMNFSWLWAFARQCQASYGTKQKSDNLTVLRVYKYFLTRSPRADKRWGGDDADGYFVRDLDTYSGLGIYLDYMLAKSWALQCLKDIMVTSSRPFRRGEWEKQWKTFQHTATSQSSIWLNSYRVRVTLW